jgi:hypothetical protein
MVAKMSGRSDEDIRDFVLLELEWDPKITSNDIAVAVKNGVVTLSGFVHSYWEKDEAEKAAKRVYGVRGVANDIQVKPVAERTDPEIARDAVQELESHISIPAAQLIWRVADLGGREGYVLYAIDSLPILRRDQSSATGKDSTRA